jgi:signal peptidase I
LPEDKRGTIAAEAVETSEPQLAYPKTSGSVRLLYWTIWFVVVPLVLACILVWALSPASSIDRPGVMGSIQSLVREQPVPVAIVAFTVFEMALWGARQFLPLARFAHPPLRADLPRGMRQPFERARGLLDEAEVILLRNEKAVVRELSSSERQKLKADLETLRGAMASQPFDEEAFVEALVRADGEVDIRLGRWRKSEVREYLESILVAIAVAMALRAFVVEAFKIPSGSMIPTLQIGDHIFVNKFIYGPAIPWTDKRLWTSMPPHRGDVMVFAFPEHPEQDFIKRVIALPGDKLEAKNGHPWINGWEVPSCAVGTYSYTEVDQPNPSHEGELYVEYLEDQSFLTLYDRANGSYSDSQGPFYVPQGEVYVMGDNRNNSHDSRMWWGGRGGGVPYANIRGKALFVWLSVTETGVDISREGAPVMGRPRLPPAMKGLEPALEKCLRERPPIEKTTPPPQTLTR